MKKSFLIAGVGIALIVIVGALIFIIFFMGKGEPAETPGPAFGTSDESYVENGEPLPLGQVGEGQAGEEVAPKLIKITSGPVSFGSVAFPVGIPGASSTDPVSYDTEIRFQERSSGNIYAYRVGERTLARISNRTLPGVYETSWVSDGSLAYSRFLSETDGKETIETYVLPVGESEGGYFLEPGLSEVSVQGTTSVVTLLPSTSGSIATLAAPDGTNVKTLFSSPLSALHIFFSGNNLVASTKASAHTNGYAYFVSKTAGTFERFAGPLRGLAALPSPKGTYAFYTYLSGNTLRSELITASDRIPVSIPLGTLAEKCAWTPDETSIYCAVPRSIEGALPDDWYQGAVSFSDRIWRVSLDGRIAALIVDPKTVGDVDIDAVNLTIDARADVLVFTNKKDGSLWSYDI